VQAGDRVSLLHALGNLVQQSVALLSFSLGVMFFSVPVFLLLAVALIPAFLGETHLAFLGYSLAHRLTALRRELDYIRTLGTSKEGAKEIRLFALGPYFRKRFAQANQILIASHRTVQIQRPSLGAVLGLIGSLNIRSEANALQTAQRSTSQPTRFDRRSHRLTSLPVMPGIAGTLEGASRTT